MSQTANFSPPQLGVLVLAAVVFLPGIGVLLFGAYFAHRLTYGSSSKEQTPSALLLWAKIWFIDLIACILLFTAVNAFRWLPFFSIVLKAGVIIVASLVFSGVSSWLAWERRGGE
ncbi:MAG TPA: hypothetical protein VF043_31640 [Ktedonobacteraceae bacterium]